ncbi:MAG: hypothetical protein AAF840_04560, partial [Bacteroidota bacterium]
MSHYKILSLLPDSNGMWIGTQDGLDFYDGYRWEHWPGKKGRLTEQEVNFLHKDQAGYLWIFHTQRIKERQTVSSIDLLSPARDTTFSVLDATDFSLPFNVEDLQHFFTDADQRLYFFARDQLWRYSLKDQFEVILLPSGFQPAATFTNGAFIGRKQDELVLITANGELLQTLDYPLENKPFSFLGDQEQFWIHQFKGGCVSYQQQIDGTYQSKIVPLPGPTKTFPALLDYNTQRKELWVKNRESSYLLNAQNEVVFHYPRTARRVVHDQHGNYWLGKSQIELVQLQPKRFERLLRNEDGERRNRVRCRGIIEKEGQLYVQTYGGIRRIDLQSFRVDIPTNFDSLGFSFLEDREGHLWLGRSALVQLDSTETKVEKLFATKKRRIW